LAQIARSSVLVVQRVLRERRSGAGRLREMTCAGMTAKMADMARDMMAQVSAAEVSREMAAAGMTIAVG